MSHGVVEDPIVSIFRISQDQGKHIFLNPLKANYCRMGEIIRMDERTPGLKVLYSVKVGKGRLGARPPLI